MAIRSFKDKTPQIAQDVFVDPMSTITGDVNIGTMSSIWPNVSIRGDLLAISIGEKSNIQDNSVLHTSQFPQQNYSTTIGNEVTVGHGAILHGCTIGNRVLVGMGSIVLDGAIVEDDVIIGAGSVVSPGKTLESGYLYFGSPAKQIRPLKENEKLTIITNAQNYYQIIQEHKNALSNSTKKAAENE